MRDFFYNKGDVLIAILIILVAAFVIYLRIGVIMDYSTTGEKGEGLLPIPPLFGITNEPADGTEAGAGSGQDGGETPVSDPPAEQPPAEQPSAGQPSAGQPAPEQPAPQPGTVQITVNPGDAASTIADKLYAVGAIQDRQAFLTEVMNQGAETRLKTGTFVIPEGASLPEIIEILVG